MPGSPFYNPVRRDPNLPADGPERYVCRVATNNPVPNAVGFTFKLFTQSHPQKKLFDCSSQLRNHQLNNRIFPILVLDLAELD